VIPSTNIAVDDKASKAILEIRLDASLGMLSSRESNVLLSFFKTP